MGMCNRRSILPIALFSLVGVTAAVAGIIPGSSVTVAVNRNYPFSADTTLSSVSSAPGALVDLSLTAGSDVSTWGTASLGVLHLSESAHAHSDGTTTQQSTALVVTEWQDVLTFTPSSATADVHFSTGFWIHGNASTSAGLYNLATTNFRWQVDGFDNSGINHVTYQGQRVTRSNGFNEGTDYYDTVDPRGTYVSIDLPTYFDPGGTLYVNFAVTFGAGVSASTTFPGVVDDANSSLNLADTVLWGGIQILDGSNSPVSGTLSSSTGFDWSVAQSDAPEPASWFLCGVVVVAASCVRRLRPSTNA